MTDEKMIEEMAVICGDRENSCDECFSEYEKVIWKHKIKIEDRAKHCQAILHAQRLYNAGYRKIPKNVVVIPEKIDEKTSTEDIIKIAKYNESVRKETAREILQFINDDRSGYWDSCDCGKDETYWRDKSIQGTLNEIAEKYGVEVEE